VVRISPIEIILVLLVLKPQPRKGNGAANAIKENPTVSVLTPATIMQAAPGVAVAAEVSARAGKGDDGF
jgi:hypothetical protein